jgi:hypothetical protein
MPSRNSRWPRRLTAALGLLLALASGLGVSLRAARVGKDGQVAFLRLTAGHWQVWLMGPEGSAARQLTFSPVDKYSISWCSNNKVLHFYTALGDSTFLDLATGRTRSVIPMAPIHPRGPFGDLLPFELNARHLATDSGRASLPWPNCGIGELDEVVALRSPAALPEGILVAVAKKVDKDEKTRFEIGILDESRLDELSRAGSGERAARYHRVLSKNGDAALVSNREGAAELFRIGSREARVRLTDMGVDVGSPSWSSDGRFLYFDAAPEGVRQIFRMSADGTGLAQLTHEKTHSRGPVFATPEAP